MIYRILEKKLEEKYSVEKIVNTLREMNFRYYRGHGYSPVYTRTEITDDLHDIFNFETDREIISEANMKKIIKKQGSKNNTTFFNAKKNQIILSYSI